MLFAQNKIPPAYNTGARQGKVNYVLEGVRYSH